MSVARIHWQVIQIKRSTKYSSIYPFWLPHRLYSRTFLTINYIQILHLYHWICMLINVWVARAVLGFLCLLRFIILHAFFFNIEINLKVNDRVILFLNLTLVFDLRFEGEDINDWLVNTVNILLFRKITILRILSEWWVIIDIQITLAFFIVTLFGRVITINILLTILEFP